ncbi:MAG: hypothetical protein ACFFC1_15010 [Promethearchaeota archaeon]
MTKILFWTNPSADIKIIEATNEAADKYGHYYGSDLIELNNKHIKALREGKMLAWNDSEYATFVILKK